jgi:hypothetical protein
MAQTTLGIYPFAPAHVLALARPRLPVGLRTVVVRNIGVGEARVSIRFERFTNGTTTYDVFDKTGPVHVVAVPPPQEEHGEHSWRDSILAWMIEHAPGRTAAALRIALGDDQL